MTEKYLNINLFWPIVTPDSKGRKNVHLSVSMFNICVHNRARLYITQKACKCLYPCMSMSVRARMCVGAHLVARVSARLSIGHADLLMPTHTHRYQVVLSKIPSF